MVIIYLAATLLLQSCCLPFNVVTCVTSGEPPFSDSYRNADIRGITAHKVYPIYALLQKPVSSYLTFSPLLLSCHAQHVKACQERSGNFLWHFLPQLVGGRPLTGVLPFAVRTFLPTAIPPQQVGDWEVER
jgi:hypothetical protein